MLPLMLLSPPRLRHFADTHGVQRFSSPPPISLLIDCHSALPLYAMLAFADIFFDVDATLRATPILRA